jgi:hypothetical protein
MSRMYISSKNLNVAHIFFYPRMFLFLSMYFIFLLRSLQASDTDSMQHIPIYFLSYKYVFVKYKTCNLQYPLSGVLFKIRLIEVFV